MESFKKYLKYFIILVLITIPFITPAKITFAWLGIVATIIGIILLFEYIEKSRTARIEKWSDKQPAKSSYMLMFSLLLGVPVSILILFIIRAKAQLLFSIIFIAIPLVLIFAWIGKLEWEKCNDCFIEKNIIEKHN